MQQGVLWKRRDVFKNRWRPRWFVLQPEQGVLVYYLLSNTSSNNDSFSTPRRSNSTLRNPNAPATAPPNLQRDRTASWDSQVSERTLEFDVVPRGTIFLQDCDVLVNESLSKPEEDLFAFTIRPPNDRNMDIHLAASSSRVREVWVQKIGRVCRTIGSNQQELNQSSNHSDVVPQMVVAQESRQPEWTSVADDAVLYQGVATTLAADIKEKLHRNLSCLLDPDWKRTNQRQDFATYQKQDASGRLIVKSEKTINAPIKQIFQLLIDIRRRTDFETNVEEAVRLKQLNSFTFFDHYSYKAVWPTKPRDFAVVLHWQLLRNTAGKPAIVLLAFSTPEADSLVSGTDSVVRAILIVSLYLLQPLQENSCVMTRLLSFDPSGGLSKQIANVAVSQQARLPAVIASYLAKKREVTNGFSAELTSDSIIEEVIESLPSTEQVPEARRLHFDSIEEARSISVDNRGVSWDAKAFLLYGPVVLFQVVRYIGLPFPFVWFLVFVFLSIRELVLLENNVYESVDGSDTVIPVRCRFFIDLKGALRFISNKKEDREELQTGQSEVSIVHLVISAVAKVLKNEPALRQKHLEMPLLMIDHLMDVSDQPVTVSVSENAGDVVTLKDVASLSVQEIADRLAVAEHVHDATKQLGECLVVTTGSETDGDIEMDIISLVENVTVVLVLGGVSLRRVSGSNESRPYLSLSLTIRCSQLSDIATCRHFVEELRKSLDFPEIVDNI